MSEMLQAFIRKVKQTSGHPERLRKLGYTVVEEGVTLQMKLKGDDEESWDESHGSYSAGDHGSPE